MSEWSKVEHKDFSLTSLLESSGRCQTEGRKTPYQNHTDQKLTALRRMKFHMLSLLTTQL